MRSDYSLQLAISSPQRSVVQIGTEPGYFVFPSYSTDQESQKSGVSVGYEDDGMYVCNELEKQVDRHSSFGYLLVNMQTGGSLRVMFLAQSHARDSKHSPGRRLNAPLNNERSIHFLCYM